jgi:ABC-2 type transport system ATP-binding protein
MTGAAMEFRGLVKRYGKTTVLDGLDLSVPAGAAFALVGANGAGKTTCIKTLLDFGVADEGAVRIFGTDHKFPAARSRVSFLPERFLPPFHLTGLEFLAYSARLHGVAPCARAARRMAQALDLDPAALERPARTYSKGMAQKLGLSASLLADRALLVLDEPMSGLDPKARLLVKRQLRELGKQQRTLFFSTHVLADCRV